MVWTDEVASWSQQHGVPEVSVVDKLPEDETLWPSFLQHHVVSSLRRGEDVRRQGGAETTGGAQVQLTHLSRKGKGERERESCTERGREKGEKSYRHHPGGQTTTPLCNVAPIVGWGKTQD